MSITLTDRAEQYLTTVLASKGENPRRGFRISLLDGGCGGHEYNVAITTHPTDADVTIQQGTVKLYIDRQSLPLLEGIQVDYVEGLIQSGFKFSNPNATSTCGCGKSFSTEASCIPTEATCS